MIEKSEIFNTVLDCLNLLLSTDPRGIESMFFSRHIVSDEVANLPMIVTSQRGGDERLSPLGLINALVEPLTGKRVAMMVPDTSNSIIAFVEYTGPIN